MGFQTCPKCDGSGKRFNPLPETSGLAIMINAAATMPIPYKDKDGNIKFHTSDNTCPVCKGKMIISTETGKPPIE